MRSVDQSFYGRIEHVPRHGLGLSVDVYSPAIADVLKGLQAAGLSCDYWELFRASTSVLTRVRRLLPGVSLEYHAEGLWLTQPYLDRIMPFADELRVATDHLNVLGSTWMNHECASKQMGGYTFGTYLPPLLTTESAEVTAQNARYVQRALDESCSGGSAPPLLLLEVPPLTYFQYGTLSVPVFFQMLTAHAPCGLVLDVGHIWTIYRYAGYWRSQSLEHFLSEFLDSFPLDRVVEIHMAGLGEHPRIRREVYEDQESLPLWIDSHEARIPDTLWMMLHQILAHPGLRHLRGIALEVDGKSVPIIVEEFRRFHRLYGQWKGSGAGMMSEATERGAFPGTGQVGSAVPPSIIDRAVRGYSEYSQVILGKTSLAHNAPQMWPGAVLHAYRDYLREEIMEWGGRMEDMFPETCRALEAEGFPLGKFVEFWFQDPGWGEQEPYDFFLFKIRRYLAFVERTCPVALPRAWHEASQLRASYRLATEEPAGLSLF